MDKKNYYLGAKELFYMLTAALAVFFVLEYIWPGVVLSRLNVNFVLIIWVINATLVLVFSPESESKF